MSKAENRHIYIGQAMADGAVLASDSGAELVRALAAARGVQRLLGDRHGAWTEFAYRALMTTMQSAGHLQLARYANGRVSAVGYTATVCRAGKTNQSQYRVRLTTELRRTGPAWYAVPLVHGAEWCHEWLYRDRDSTGREPYLITTCRLLSLEDAAAVLHPDLDTARAAWSVKLAKHSIANEEVQEAYIRYMTTQIASI